VIDGTAGSTRGDLHLIYLAQQLGKPVLLVFNKSDLMTGRAMVFHHHIDKFPHVIVSALTGDGLAKVGDWIIDRLVKK
jgi:predicted GTPase